MYCICNWHIFSWSIPWQFKHFFNGHLINTSMICSSISLVFTWRVSNDQPWASYQIRKIAGCACAGNAGNVSPRRQFQRKPLVSDPGMHHGTCVTHVPWCMSGSLTCDDGENVPGIPGACAPAILRIWQEAHIECFHVLSQTVNRAWLNGKVCKLLIIVSNHSINYSTYCIFIYIYNSNDNKSCTFADNKKYSRVPL